MNFAFDSTSLVSGALLGGIIAHYAHVFDGWMRYRALRLPSHITLHNPELGKINDAVVGAVAPLVEKAATAEVSKATDKTTFAVDAAVTTELDRVVGEVEQKLSGIGPDGVIH